MIIKNEFNPDELEIVKNCHFINKTSLAKYLLPVEALAKIVFVDCIFDNVDLFAYVFTLCSFKNCRINNLITRKGEFHSCHFENCKITNSNMTRVDFNDINFTNCYFLNVDFGASIFRNCKFKTTHFSKSNLNYISTKNAKLWKSNQWVDLYACDFSILENNDLNE